jgi:hypothetical protein
MLLILPLGLIGYTKVTAYIGGHPYILIEAELLLVARAVVTNL